MNENTSYKTGAYALLDSLVNHKVTHIFGYPGGAILPIYDELYTWEKKKLVRHILGRHEQGSIHAADAYARSTGRIGICFATSGPGATNLVTGIATAQMDSVPILVITGQVARSFIGTDAFQEVDIFGITMPIVKHSYVVRDPRDMAITVAEAIHLAISGRPGPVLIDIPKDVGLEKFDYLPIKPGNVNIEGYHTVNQSSFKQIEYIVELLEESRQPLLYVGGGAIISEAHNEIMKLSNMCQIPVTTTLMGKGTINESDTLALGMLGMHGTAYANFAVSECDLLIALGARFDDRVTGKLDEFACNAQVIHIDIDPAEIGKNRVPDIAIVGDIRLVLQKLIPIIRNRNNLSHVHISSWKKRIFKWKQQYPLLVPKQISQISPQEILSKLSLLAPEAYYTTDVGQHQMWAAQFIQVLPRHWMSSAGLGTMGYGLPAAIGVQVAFPNNHVICISGDSSFQMNLQELGTVAQYNLPIKILIINNKWQGMVRQWQEAFYGQRYSHSHMAEGAPNFKLLMESYGLKGMELSERSKLQTVLAEFIACNEPILLNCHVIEEENCYPMVAPGKSNAQMIGVSKPQRRKV